MIDDRLMAHCTRTRSGLRSCCWSSVLHMLHVLYWARARRGSRWRNVFRGLRMKCLLRLRTDLVQQRVPFDVFQIDFPLLRRETGDVRPSWSCVYEGHSDHQEGEEEPLQQMVLCKDGLESCRIGTKN